MVDTRQSANEIGELRSGAIFETRARWRAQMHDLIDELTQLSNLNQADEEFFERGTDLAVGFIAQIGGVLSDAMLAAYLLGVDQIGWECKAMLMGRGICFVDAQFAFPSCADFNFDQSPSKGVRYLKRKRLVAPVDLAPIAREAEDAAFELAELYQQQSFSGFKASIKGGLEGRPKQAIISDLRRLIRDETARHPLGPAYLKDLVSQVVAFAYGLGRRRSMESLASALPFWQYHAGESGTTHEALDGVVARALSCFWDDRYPPWGSANCQCVVTASEKSAARPSIVTLPDGDRQKWMAALGPTPLSGVPPAGRLADAPKWVARRLDFLAEGIGARMARI
jgi:hypothetical protein